MAAVSEAPRSRDPSALPNDVAYALIENVKVWANDEDLGRTDHFRNEREKRRKLRDSTIHGLALTSSSAHQLYLPYLLENVSILSSQIPYLFVLLKNRPELGASIKSFRLSRSRVRESEYHPSFNMKDWNLGGELPEIATPFITHKLKPGFERDVQAHEAMVDYILSQCPNLQSLVDADPLYSFSLKSSSKLMPFLTHSLKRLFIPTGTVFELPPSALSVETVIWILVFCKSLEQVVLGVFVGAKGERYLAEYTSTFKGLSNVKQVAFSFYFDWNNPKANLRWKCGSRKSDTVFNFLQVTSSRLESAELSVNARMDSNQLESDSNKEVCVDAISGLSNSFSSLKHLRLIGLFPDFEKKKLTDFTVFSSLKCLSVEGVILQVLAVLPSPLPPNLEVLHCPFHAYQGSGDTSDGFEEDEYLSHIIERPIPKLKQVVVPGTPISIFGELPISKQQISIWKGYRKQFSETSIFKSGKVKLKELMPGETIGDPLKGEHCLSVFGFLSSFPA